MFHSMSCIPMPYRQSPPWLLLRDTFLQLVHHASASQDLLCDCVMAHRKARTRFLFVSCICPICQVQFDPKSIINAHNDRPGNIILLYEQRNRLLHTYIRISRKITAFKASSPSLSTATATPTLDTYYKSPSWLCAV